MINFQCVEENYDIPRSHQMPYYNLNSSHEADEQQHSPTLSLNSDAITASTPNLSEQFSTMSMTSTPQSKFSTMQHKPRHFYTNAAPTKIEGNVFRYDFDEQASLGFFLSINRPYPNNDCSHRDLIALGRCPGRKS